MKAEFQYTPILWCLSKQNLVTHMAANQFELTASFHIFSSAKTQVQIG